MRTLQRCPDKRGIVCEKVQYTARLRVDSYAVRVTDSNESR